MLAGIFSGFVKGEVKSVFQLVLDNELVRYDFLYMPS